jgi:hypothetical protein
MTAPVRLSLTAAIETFKDAETSWTAGGMTMDIFYRGFGLQLEPFGPGYRVSIFPPGEIWCMANAPASVNPSKRDTLIAEAEAIVDAHLSAYD